MNKIHVHVLENYEIIMCPIDDVFALIFHEVDSTLFQKNSLNWLLFFFFLLGNG